MREQLDSEIERIHASWNALEQVIRGLTDADWVQVTDGKWSVQDHLAHIALFEQYSNAILRQEPPHIPFGIDAETLLKLNEEELNEVGYERTRALATNEVEELRRKAHHELLETLKGLSDDDLAKPCAPYGKPLGPTCLDTLRGNSSLHYDEHRPWIEEMLTRAKSHGGTATKAAVT